MSNSLPAKQISELVETIQLQSIDQMPVNVYDHTIGYRLTKKVSIQNLAKYVENEIRKMLSDDYALSDLAHYDIPKLVGEFMQHHSKLSSMSLALSSLGDLNLGDLSGVNLADLHLERFAEKSYATGSFNTDPGEYVDGITQTDGKITQVHTGSFKDAVPIDTAIDATSHHAVENAVIKAELDKKVNLNDTNIVYPPTEGVYVAGLTQENGKITALHKYQLPKQPIDSVLDASSKNPVENRVVKNAIESLESRMYSDVDSNYVKLTDANAYFKAPAGKFITAIRQENGRIVSIETSDFNQMFANLEKKINDLIARYEAEIASLQTTLDNKYLKLSHGSLQTVAGPVKFGTKVDGRITNADYANKANWS